jgi:hypothetical protein
MIGEREGGVEMLSVGAGGPGGVVADVFVDGITPRAWPAYDHDSCISPEPVFS